MLLTGLGREIHRRVWAFLRRQGVLRDNLLIVGEGRIAHDITEKIRNSPSLGYDIVGIVSASDESQDEIPGISIIGKYADIPRLIDEHMVEQVIVALSDPRRGELVELINLCQRGRVDIKVYPDLFSYMAGDLNVDDLGGTPLLTVRDIALRGWKLSLKARAGSHRRVAWPHLAFAVHVVDRALDPLGISWISLLLAVAHGAR